MWIPAQEGAKEGKGSAKTPEKRLPRIELNDADWVMKRKFDAAAVERKGREIVLFCSF
jgi:hypothetical protein